MTDSPTKHWPNHWENHIEAIKSILQEGMDAMMKPEISIQIAKIRVNVRRDGESLVGRDQLRLLRDSEVGLEAQLTALNEIAQWEHWDFDYLADGRVRFSSSTS